MKKISSSQSLRSYEKRKFKLNNKEELKGLLKRVMKRRILQTYQLSY